MTVRPDDPTPLRRRPLRPHRTLGTVLIAAIVVVSTAAPALAQGQSQTPAEDTSLFDGFGFAQLVVLAVVVLATVVGLIALAWLLVLLTGADRDYLEVAPDRPADPTAGAPRLVAGDEVSPTPRATPASVMRAVRPSTWAGLGVVALLAAVSAVWLGLGGDDAGDQRTGSVSTATALDCSRVPFLAGRLPQGFSGGLRAGTGTEDAVPAGRCVWHWSAPAGVIQLLGQSAPASGPLGQIEVGDKRMWVQATLDGSTQVVFEEREFGGAAGTWYTLLSRAVDREALVNLTASLQRCQGSACNAATA